MMKKLSYILNTPTLTRWLCKARESTQVSQGKTAESIGITQMYLSALERGAPKTIRVDEWKKIYAYYMKSGVAPLASAKDPLLTIPDPTAIRGEIEEMKKATKSSLKSIALSLGVGPSSLMNFMRGESLKAPTLYMLRDGLVKLKTKPTALVDEGALETKEVRTVKTRKKTSLIEAAPTAQGLPSLHELDVMELKIIHRLRGYVEQVNEKPKTLNGHRRH